MRRPVTLIAALLTVLIAASGCAASGKSVSARRTVEVPKHEIAKPGLLDPAFAPDRLRGVDVCATLQAADLAKYGRPAEFSASGFGTCDNYMRDRTGKELDVTLRFDSDTSQPGTHRIGGLPAEVTDDSGTCFTRAAYTGADASMLAPRGLEIQLRGEQPDPCSPAVQILADVIDVLRNRPPISPRVSGGLAGFSPCRVVDPGVIRDAAMGSNADSSGGEGLYSCEWIADNGVLVDVDFELGTPQSTQLPPLDLGGVPAAVIPATDPPSCVIEWQHRKDANEAGDSEYVHVAVKNMDNIPMDPCLNATNLARQVRAKLPAA